MKRGVDKKAPFSGRKQGDLPEAEMIKWNWNGSEHKSREHDSRCKLFSPQIVDKFYNTLIIKHLPLV